MSDSISVKGGVEHWCVHPRQNYFHDMILFFRLRIFVPLTSRFFLRCRLFVPLSQSLFSFDVTILFLHLCPFAPLPSPLPFSSFAFVSLILCSFDIAVLFSFVVSSLLYHRGFASFAPSPYSLPFVIAIFQFHRCLFACLSFLPPYRFQSKMCFSFFSGVYHS